jgi:hypothetical protein
MLTANEGNNKLKKMILAGDPFCAGKIGNSEHWALINHLIDNRQWDRQIVYFITVNAGVFPAETKTLHKFADIYYRCLAQVDLAAQWLEHDEAL